MAIAIYKNLDETELDATVWRYLTFPKYVSMLVDGALWFSKLNILEDKFEGTLPKMAEAEMLADHQKLKRILHPSLHEMIDDMNRKNVKDGRELTVVNCWFLSDHESEKMWKEYANGSEGIAVQSSIRSLAENIYCDSQFSTIGKVQYVNLDLHSMSTYEANQAHERALLKQLKFSDEREVRITTMNFKGPMCVNMDGSAMKPEDYQGAKMNNFENRGLYIKADLSKLIKATVLAPDAPTWLELLVKRMSQLSNVSALVQRSRLET